MLVDQSIKRKTIATDTKPDIFVWANDDDIKALDSMFKRAARTDLRLPPVKMKRIAAAWLDMKTEWSEYGYDPKAKVTIKPTREDLSNYDKVLMLGLKLKKEDRQLIWAVALSWAKRPYGTWTRVAKKYNCSRQTVMNRYRGALQRAYIAINFYNII
tara:strand:+ start:3662 stop:4132 length:471 start_codon:yes stop_codon:yes gene_type:complete